MTSSGSLGEEANVVYLLEEDEEDTEYLLTFYSLSFYGDVKVVLVLFAVSGRFRLSLGVYGCSVW